METTEITIDLSNMHLLKSNQSIEILTEIRSFYLLFLYAFLHRNASSVLESLLYFTQLKIWQGADDNPFGSGSRLPAVKGKEKNYE